MAAAVAAVAALALSACSSESAGLAAQYGAGTTQNYISGDGTLQTFAVDERGEPVTFATEDPDGNAITSEDYAGQVLVVNFWYAACPPCRVEAPDLQEVNEEFTGKGAEFLGVNVRDQADTARTFEEENGLTYPSVIDTNSGNMLLAFVGQASAKAVPTTLVLDKQGRVAARYLGAVTAPGTLSDIIEQTIAEDD